MHPKMAGRVLHFTESLEAGSLGPYGRARECLKTGTPDKPVRAITRCLELAVERWPIAGSFTIARGAKTEAVVVVATIREGGFAGRGEAVPYPRYGETVDGVADDYPRHGRRPRGRHRSAGTAESDAGRRGPERPRLRTVGPRGQALRHIGSERRRVARASPARDGVHHQPRLRPRQWRRRPRPWPDRPLLKVKVGGDGDPARLAAVRAAAPKARLIDRRQRILVGGDVRSEHGGSVAGEASN